MPKVLFLSINPLSLRSILNSPRTVNQIVQPPTFLSVIALYCIYNLCWASFSTLTFLHNLLCSCQGKSKREYYRVPEWVFWGCWLHIQDGSSQQQSQVLWMCTQGSFTSKKDVQNTWNAHIILWNGCYWNGRSGNRASLNTFLIGLIEVPIMHCTMQ